MAHTLDSMPVPVTCDSFGPPPDFNTPTGSLYTQGMALGQNAIGEAAWLSTRTRSIGRNTSGPIVPGYQVYWFGDLGAPITISLWNPLNVLLCNQNELWIKNVSQFALTVTLSAGTFDFQTNTLTLPGRTAAGTAAQGGASVHLICQPQTANWLIIASHRL